MKKETPQGILENYLGEIERELGNISPAAKGDFLAEIRGHLTEQWEEAPEQSSAEMLNILERFGDPYEIAAEFRGKAPEREVISRSYPPTWLVLVLTVLIWPVGIILAWLSPAWETKDKLIATLIPPVLLLLIITFSFVTYHTYSAVEAQPYEYHTETRLEGN